ncbi:acetate--CoA ligase [Histoplasma capsulatum G186AR]|nr:acetate--CoA ligase [Histoplasma capsulatum G186AR]
MVLDVTMTDTTGSEVVLTTLSTFPATVCQLQKLKLLLLNTLLWLKPLSLVLPTNSPDRRSMRLSP